MENCSLKIRLPRRGDKLPHPYTLPSTWDTVPLDVCELDVKRPLKEWAISWATRPNCIRSLGTANAKVGGEFEIRNFSCKSGSFVGYQISCSQPSPQCDLDVWTNQNATWGEFVVFSPSVQENAETRFPRHFHRAASDLTIAFVFIYIPEYNAIRIRSSPSSSPECSRLRHVGHSHAACLCTSPVARSERC